MADGPGHAAGVSHLGKPEAAVSSRGIQHLQSPEFWHDQHEFVCSAKLHLWASHSYAWAIARRPEPAVPNGWAAVHAVRPQVYILKEFIREWRTRQVGKSSYMLLLLSPLWSSQAWLGQMRIHHQPNLET